MPVELIESPEAFAALAADWQALYRLDVQANWFLSWSWMAPLHARRDEPPCVLAWRVSDEHSSPWQALLPLRRQVRLSRTRGEFYNAICLAGNYWADYTGLLCDPAMDHHALPELGQALAALGWQRMFLESLSMSPERQALLLEAYFDAEQFRLEPRALTDNDGRTDLARAPVLALPATVERWQQVCLSANTRQKIRRFRRRLEQDADVQIRRSDAATRRSDLAALQRLWRARWVETKGQRVDLLAEKYTAFVRQGLESGDMSLLVLECAGEPVALHAYYLDRVRGAVLFFVGARDNDFDRLPAGLMLHAHTIEWAIEQGFAHYHLLRGNEPYKYSLGAQDQVLVTLDVTRRQMRTAHRFLHPAGRPAALATLARYQQNARERRVMSLYSQLLESWPGDRDVLRQFAHWLRGAGHLHHAKEIEESLSAVQDEPGAPDVMKARPAHLAWVENSGMQRQ